jgi:alginate O-acetyltransferase complex protein AlgI
MSLSTWFRDYLYIPLGGNRGSAQTTYRNLIIVFLLCGLWHGANWVFLAWGAFHGAFLVFERTGARRWIERMPRVLQHAYLLGVVMAAWVLFRSESLAQAIGYWGALLGAAPVSNPIHPLAAYASHEFITAALVGMIGATQLPARLARQLRGREPRPRAAFTTVAAMVILMVLSSAYLAAGTHNPFIYFRF